MPQVHCFRQLMSISGPICMRSFANGGGLSKLEHVEKWRLNTHVECYLINWHLVFAAFDFFAFTKNSFNVLYFFLVSMSLGESDYVMCQFSFTKCKCIEYSSKWINAIFELPCSIEFGLSLTGILIVTWLSSWNYENIYLVYRKARCKNRVWPLERQ